VRQWALASERNNQHSTKITSLTAYYLSLLSSLRSHFLCSLSFLQLLILVNGKDCFTYTVPLPAAPNAVPKIQYYIAGGAVSTHTTDRHLQLVNAENLLVTWRLESLQVLRGMCWEFMMHSLNCNGHLCVHLNYIIEEGREKEQEVPVY